MRSHDEEVESSYPPMGSFASVDDWAMHHLTVGRGRDVLLLHGAGGSIRDMSFTLMPRLAKLASKLRITAVDRPGHGYTRGPDATSVISPIEQAALIWRFCDTQRLVKPLILGQSYGGAVALAMAALRPNGASGLCLVSAASSEKISSTPIGMETITRVPLLQQAALKAMRSPRFIEMSIEKLFAPERVPYGYLEYFGPEMSLRDGVFRHQMKQVACLSETLRSIAPEFSRITMPVEILHGDMDAVLDCSTHGRWLSGQIKHARYTELPGAGHMPHHTRAEDVTDAVIRMVSAG